MGKFGLSDIAYKRLLAIHKSDKEVKGLVACWGVQICEKGYSQFNYDGTGLMCIERIDALDIFADDTEATEQAIDDGVKIIPIDELPKSMPSNMKFLGYIDTPKNRLRLKELYGESTVKNAQSTTQSSKHASTRAQSKVQYSKPVSGKSIRQVKVEEVKQQFNKVLDIYEDRDFTEITGKIAGDTLTFRVYNNGTVIER